MRLLVSPSTGSFRREILGASLSLNPKPQTLNPKPTAVQHAERIQDAQSPRRYHLLVLKANHGNPKLCVCAAHAIHGTSSTKSRDEIQRFITEKLS